MSSKWSYDAVEIVSLARIVEKRDIHADAGFPNSYDLHEVEGTRRGSGRDGDLVVARQKRIVPSSHGGINTGGRKIEPRRVATIVGFLSATNKANHGIGVAGIDEQVGVIDVPIGIACTIWMIPLLTSDGRLAKTGSHMVEWSANIESSDAVDQFSIGSDSCVGIAAESGSRLRVNAYANKDRRVG